MKTHFRYLIVSAGWNCGKYIDNYFSGIIKQSNSNFIVSIVNDASSDDTEEKILSYKQQGFEFFYSKNETNIKGYLSYEKAISQVDPNLYDVICFVGLDDKILPNALNIIDEQYRKGMLTTYGTYINKNGFVFQDLHYDDETHTHRAYRKVKFRCTALRTCLKELYFNLPKLEQGTVESQIYYDLDFGFSLLEQAGKDRIGVITTPIYEYNNTRPENTNTLYGKDYAIYNEICARPPRDLIDKSCNEISELKKKSYL